MSHPNKSRAPCGLATAQLEQARGALAARDAAFAAAFGATARARAARRIPASALQGIPWTDASAAAEVVSTMTTTEREALRWLDRCWPDPVPQERARFVEHTLLPLAVSGPAPDCVTNPRALVALSEALDDDADARWARRLGEDAAAARCCARAWAELASPPNPAPPFAHRIVAARRRAARAPDPASTRTLLGDALRAEAWAALSAPTWNEAWRTFLADTPSAQGYVPLDTANPLRLTITADDLLHAIVETGDPAITPQEAATVVADAWASGGDAGRVVREDLPWRGAPPALIVHLPPLDAPRLSAAAALELALQHAASGASGTMAILKDPALIHAPWSVLAGLARRDDMLASITLLERDATDWGEFDAPGEGALPEMWRLALHLAGTWSQERAEHWYDRDWVEPCSVDELDAQLRALPSPAAAALAAGDPLGGDASRAGQSVRSGIAEAYGDVHAPSDPFSTRRGATSADRDGDDVP